jgi:hypothetical protein
MSDVLQGVKVDGLEVLLEGRLDLDELSRSCASQSRCPLLLQIDDLVVGNADREVHVEIGLGHHQVRSPRLYLGDNDVLCSGLASYVPSRSTRSLQRELNVPKALLRHPEFRALLSERLTVTSVIRWSRPPVRDRRGHQVHRRGFEVALGRSFGCVLGRGEADLVADVTEPRLRPGLPPQ